VDHSSRTSDMNNITVEEAAKLVAPRLDLCYPQDKKKIYSILELVNQHCWKKGIWSGMTKEFFVNTRADGTIVNPAGYDILLKVNLNTRPVTIRSEYFQFTRNGTGSQTECCGRNWSIEVVDRGFSPVICQPFKPESCHCCTPKCQKIKLGVRSESCEEQGLHATIYGCFPDGHPVYSYKARTPETQLEGLCVPCNQKEAACVDKSKYDVIEGIEVPITDDMFIIDNVYWGEIRAIKKPPTSGAVEVYAINDHDDSVSKIARMEPPHLASCYRIWAVPQICCEWPCVHGLFKVSKPGKVLYDNQLMMINDEEAIISLSIAVHLLYYRKDPEFAARYFNIGITALSDESISEETPAFEEPIQVRDIHQENFRKRRMRRGAY
jgi:hypothetical protein